MECYLKQKIHQVLFYDYGIKVGACKETEITIDKEFDFQKKKTEVTAESILDGDAQSHNEELYVYDIVLAGVEA